MAKNKYDLVPDTEYTFEVFTGVVFKATYLATSDNFYVLRLNNKVVKYNKAFIATIVSPQFQD